MVLRSCDVYPTKPRNGTSARRPSTLFNDMRPPPDQPLFVEIPTRTRINNPELLRIQYAPLSIVLLAFAIITHGTYGVISRLIKASNTASAVPHPSTANNVCDGGTWNRSCNDNVWSPPFRTHPKHFTSRQRSVVKALSHSWTGMLS